MTVSEFSQKWRKVELKERAAAKVLDDLRSNWLNPPEWVKEEALESPGSANGPWARYVVTSKTGTVPLPQTAEEKGTVPMSKTGTVPPPQTAEEKGTVPGGIGTVGYPRLVPKDDECAKKLKTRTLTNVYNQRPAWLDLAHKKLDEAVFAAYGWPVTLSDEEILEKLLEINLAATK